MTRLVEDEVQMMMRIGWWRVVGLFAFALVIHAGRATSVAQGGEHSKRPNILFILTEDQGAQMSLLGTAGLRTPNMDRIARQGVYFRKAFVTYPVCSASKAAIYTGLYNQTNGLRQNTMNLFKAADEITPKERQHPLFRGNRILDRYPTLIECLHEAGYYTGITGKLHVLPNKKFPYDEFVKGKPSSSQVAGFISRAAETGKPWFLWYNMSPPHRPFRNSDETEIDVDPEKVSLPAFLPDTPVVRKDWAEYLDAIQIADRNVGAGLRALKESGQEENTYVIFMGDHGPCFQRGKMALYDFGLRVPLAICGPKVQKGIRSEALVSSVDLMPTILQWAGIQAPSLQNGVSLCSVLQGKSESLPRQFVFAEIAHGYPRPGGMHERSIFDGQFHLIQRDDPALPRVVNADLRDWKPWRNRTYAATIAHKDEFPQQFEMLRQIDNSRLGGRPPRVEMFDLKQDPEELRNLANDPACQAKRMQLVRALQAWIAEADERQDR